MTKVTKKELETLLQTNTNLIVEFYNDSCGACKMLEKQMSELPTGIKMVKINTSEELELAKSIGVKQLPTVLYFTGHEITDAFVGFRPLEHLKVFINRNAN